MTKIEQQDFRELMSIVFECFPSTDYYGSGFIENLKSKGFDTRINSIFNLKGVKVGGLGNPICLGDLKCFAHGVVLFFPSNSILSTHRIQTLVRKDGDRLFFYKFNLKPKKLNPIFEIGMGHMYLLRSGDVIDYEIGAIPQRCFEWF